MWTTCQYSVTFLGMLLWMTTSTIYGLYDLHVRHERSLDNGYCHVANRTCFQDRKNCEPKMRMVRALCGTELNYCKLSMKSASLKICRKHLASLPQSEPAFNCFCPVTIDTKENFDACQQVWMFLFEHPCSSDPPKYLTTQSSVNTEPPVVAPELPIQSNKVVTPKPTHEPQSVLDSLSKINVISSNLGSGKNCLIVHRSCSDDPLCWQKALVFSEECGFQRAEQCLQRRTECIKSFARLRNYFERKDYDYFPCTCSTDDEECRRVHDKYPGNACLRYFNEAYKSGLSAGNTDGNNQNPPVIIPPQKIPEISNPPTKNPVIIAPQRDTIRPKNCYSIYRRCLRQSTCVERFVALKESCQWSEGRCLDYDKCLSQLVSFYTYVDEYAREAATCQCQSDDLACQQLLQVFHPRCAYDHPEPISCLDLIQLCQRKNRCLGIFHVYGQNCDTEEGKCGTAPSECHNLRRLLLGTVLTRSCGCEAALDKKLYSYDALTACRATQQLLRDPKCLKLAEHVPVDPIPYEDVCKLQSTHYMSSGSYLRVPVNTTCSRLCECSYGGFKKCESVICHRTLLPSSITCHQDSKYCRCVRGEYVCSPRVFNRSTGLYLTLGYSKAEAGTLSRHGIVAPDDWGVRWTKFLNQTVGPMNHCLLKEISRQSGGVVLRVSDDLSWWLGGSHVCEQYLQLLQIMVQDRHLGVTLTPQLSHFYTASFVKLDNHAAFTEKVTDFDQRKRQKSAFSSLKVDNRLLISICTVVFLSMLLH